MFITRKRYETAIEKAVCKAMEEREQYDYLCKRIDRVGETQRKDHENVMKILNDAGLIKPDAPGEVNV